MFNFDTNANAQASHGKHLDNVLKINVGGGNIGAKSYVDVNQRMNLQGDIMANQATAQFRGRMDEVKTRSNKIIF